MMQPTLHFGRCGDQNQTALGSTNPRQKKVQESVPERKRLSEGKKTSRRSEGERKEASSVFPRNKAQARKQVEAGPTPMYHFIANKSNNEQ